MEFLAPTTGLIAASLAVPALVAMYFLKLKRTERAVSSTLLWKRAVRDLQVNAPFQRLRRNLLLLLQLLALGAILLALARPVMSLRSGEGQRFVILIDRSASMSVREGEGTRLDQAKRQASEFVGTLRSRMGLLGADASDQAMIIAFDAGPKVLTSFTSNPHRLTRAIESIEPTDRTSNLGEALTVARAFAQSPGEEMNNRSAEQQAMLVLFSDGRIHDQKQLIVTEDEMQFFCVGEPADNVAVTAMEARRSYEQPAEVHVFATLSNYAAEPVESDVELTVNGDIRAVRRVTVPARDPNRGDTAGPPGGANVTFVLDHPDSAVIGVRQLHGDALSADDAAWSVVDPPRRLRVRLVTEGNEALELALRACPLEALDVVAPGELAGPEASAGGAGEYDVTVLDGPPPVELGPGRYLVFGAPPPQLGIPAERADGPQIIVDWQVRHPVLQHVNLANLYAAESWKLSLPREAEVLAEFNEAPAIALLRRGGSAWLLVSANVLATNWPFEPSFVLFLYNATAVLGTDAAEGDRRSLTVGEAISLRAQPGQQAVFTGPGLGDGREVSADAGGVLRLPQTRLAGLYRAEIPGVPPAHVAVNLTDPAESDPRPNPELTMTGQVVEATRVDPGRANTELWPLLVAVALGVALVEWLVYNSRVRL